MNKAKAILKDKAIYVVLLALIVFFSVNSSAFLTMSNILSIARQVTTLGIASVGMTYVILLGGIDLAQGSMITIVNIVGAYLMVKMGISPVLACLAALAVSTLSGLFNGIVIANLKMPPLIVTFATQTILEGLAFILCGGIPISGLPEKFAFIGQGYVGPIPFPVILLCLIMLIGGVILSKTYFGRYFYAVGGNEEAAQLSGIQVKKVKYLVYTLSGFFAGLAGIVMLSRVNSGQATAGKGYEFDVITAVVLGGVSVNGGEGKMSGVVAGVLIMGVLSNGMVLINMSSYLQMVIKGVILLLAVGFDCFQKMNAERAISHFKCAEH